MPCCSLKDAPSVTERTHLPQKQQTMFTETIVALVQWQRRKAREGLPIWHCKKQRSVPAVGGQNHLQCTRALCCSTSTETLPLLLVIKSSPSVTLLIGPANPLNTSVLPFLTKPATPTLLAGRGCAKCLQKINSDGLQQSDRCEGGSEEV